MGWGDGLASHSNQNEEVHVRVAGYKIDSSAPRDRKRNVAGINRIYKRFDQLK